MKHPLFVGYFQQTGSHGQLPVSRQLRLHELYPVLLEACDRRPDGSPWVVTEPLEVPDSRSLFLGRIGGEDLFLQGGYLVCPWLGAGFNQPALRLALRLYEELGCQIYEPGDGRFYTPEQLRALEEQFGRPQNRGQKRARKAL